MPPDHNAILELLENVTASLDTVMAHYGPAMPPADRVSRDRLVSEAKKAIGKARKTRKVTPLDHKHFVTVIETQAPDIYNGARVAVFHTRQEAVDDLLEWLNDEMDTDHDDADEAIAEYEVRTSCLAKIEQPDGSECLCPACNQVYSVSLGCGCHGDPPCPPS